MQAAKIKKYSTLILTALLIINGCSSPPVTTGKKEKKIQSDSAVTTGKNVIPSASVEKNQPLKDRSDYSQQTMPLRGNRLSLQSETTMIKIAAPAAAGYSNDHLITPFLSQPGFNRESYNYNRENGFTVTRNTPLSTFSIDVDTASYSNIRRFIQGGQLPPVGAVRIEEMINYFSYDYPEPQSEPFSISTELGPCPWNQKNRVIRIGIKAKGLDQAHLPASNLVFLIDVSGSMNHANKLPLLKKSMEMLVDTLTKNDRISIVVYAGSNRIVLRPTPGDKKDQIRSAIRNLTSSGSTNASGGIQAAYRLARQSFMPGENNRIILASDGDFNVGVTSRGELERLIAEKKDSGVYLTVLGFGMGNFHDDTMEILADRGNGNYAYIDSLLEAKKVLVKERANTLFTLADDVKLQIEFNPAKVGSYRLLGYENRALADEDFNNDKKDAGEIGIGHTVTALYEIIPPGSASIPQIDPLKYQNVTKMNHTFDEILTVKLRYKPRGSTKSLLITHTLANGNLPQEAVSTDFRFATAVAEYGLLLQHSKYKGKANYADLITLARGARGSDDNGYRAQFVQLLEMSELISR